MSQAARCIANDPDSKPAILRLALWYADAANRMSASPSAEFLDTLAICQARTGRFDEATKTATQAVEQARKRGDTYLAGRYEVRADRFRKKQTHLPDGVKSP